MRVAVVGMGSAGRRHLGNLLRLGVRDLLAVSEHNRLPSLAIDGTDVAVAHDFAAACAPGIDAVVIANPSVFHLDHTRRALAAGKHVYLEKPAAVSAEGLPELVAEAARRRLVVAMGTQHRFTRRLEELHARLAEAGLILCVHAMLGEHIADYHPGEDYRQSYTARAALGGGVLLTQIHQLDYLNWLFGPFDTVYALGGRRSALEIDVEDSASYLLRAASGTPVFGHLDYLQRPKRVGVEVTGEHGRFVWDHFDNSLTFLPARAGAVPEISREPFDRNAAFLACMADFLAAVQGGGAPRATLADGLAALRLVDAVKRSSATNQAVEIPR